VPDRLRDLLDLVVGTLDDPAADGRELARRAAFSRDHLDRVLAAATGETPVGLRRRLLLERAAWTLRAGEATPTEAAAPAGYASLPAFSRAFARAYGVPPASFRASGRPVALPAPNGIHFLAPAGFVVPGRRSTPPTAGGDLTERLVGHHLDRVRELLVAGAAVPAADLARPLRPGFVAVWFEGEEPSAALMAQRLVGTLEVWTAALLGEPAPGGDPGGPGAGPGAGAAGLLERFDRVAPRFAAFARRVRDSGGWDDAFVDALCAPPQAFTHGGVLAHVLTYGAIRREALASVLGELGAGVPDTADPILWEAAGRVAAHPVPGTSRGARRS
jgi:AraC-like DNA-binding protein